MERADKDLAFLLRYENVAWFEDGEVRILDRRIYPAKVEFVTCRTHQEVARAITDMVTQSAGPYTAAPMGMALAAWECRGKSADEQMEYLKKAAYTISHARPTTQKRMTLLCDICLKEAERALSAGENVAEAIKNKTIELNNVRYNRMAKIGSYLVDMFPDNGTVMTHCFAETIVGTMLRECRSRGGHDPVLRRDNCRHDAQRSEARRKAAAPVLPGDETLFSGRAPDGVRLPRHGL